MPSQFDVECVTVQSGKLRRWFAKIEPGTTVESCLRQMGVDESSDLPLIENLKLANFAKPISLQTVLQPGDRIEILFPLAADPKQLRLKKLKKRR